MSLMTEYPPGTFNWTELSTTDTAGATEFYAGLFGWSFEEMPMPGEGNSYHAARNGEHLVAGVFHREDLPKIPFWHSYVAVASADECAEKAAGLGGSVLVEPFDVGEAGRMAVVQDPTGGVFQPWQAGLQTGAGIANEPVSLCWNELLTRDPEGAAKFYCDLFGWTAETTHNGLVPYTMLRNSGRAAAGIFTITEEMENVPPHWAVYFFVADVDAAAATARETGGEVHHGPADIPDVGRFALLTDPQGAFFNVIRILNPD